ncbi:hypothetical protein [Saccharibacillus deserti]|uniref:hypothetical protein n=1 Tax=Saccharibacillus deserti TaxID=1634444 RepID=UPI00155400CC|nr:hypothetical protein [Saccharibacillus deserti]
MRNKIDLKIFLMNFIKFFVVTMVVFLVGNLFVLHKEWDEIDHKFYLIVGTTMSLLNALVTSRSKE